MTLSDRTTAAELAELEHNSDHVCKSEPEYDLGELSSTEELIIRSALHATAPYCPSEVAEIEAERKRKWEMLEAEVRRLVPNEAY